MKYGMFMQPNHPPGRDIYEGIQQDLQEIEWLDALGYAEAWIGEHLSAPWEPFPAGDLIIAQGLARTKNIKLASGAYVAGFYHPAALALRIAQLDHMAQGRYMVGIAPGSTPGDFDLMGLDGNQARTAAFETIDVVQRMWTEHVGHEWEHKGKIWNFKNPGQTGPDSVPHLRPYQSPHPPLAVAGNSPGSGSLKYAGTKGFIPLSVFFNSNVLNSHWEVYTEGAASTGVEVSRDNWRVARTIFVADTDDEAKAFMRNSHWATVWKQNYLPAFAHLGWLENVKHDPSVSDDDITLDYLIDNLFLVGSPDTVAQKLNALNQEVGGFGTVLATHIDWGTLEDSQAYGSQYHRHLELLANEVMPKIDDVV